MKLYFYGLLMVIKKFVFRKNTGKCILNFVEKMGVVYIKFAQMLAMQNVGNLFTEEDRQQLSKICDHCNPIAFKKIKKMLEKEYGCSIEKKFKKVFETPVGSASISQVHKAILKNGNVVAIKIKRKDVTKKIEKDIKQIRRIVHRFGKIFKFKNYLGSDTALVLFLEWIKEETDFQNERNNIYKYYRFANSINGKVSGTKKIVVPKVYNKLCTNNIIVMEFIFSKTINQMLPTAKNKELIKKSLNDYVVLSFYALFHNMPVIFHGDPHGGNIYIEKNGNIGFLDMGLIFSFSKDEVHFVRNLFLNAYLCNIEELTSLLLDGCNKKDVDIEIFKKEVEACCKQFKNIPVTKFYINMIEIYTKFNIEPYPNLYKMAKAFVSLFGINTIFKNSKSTEQLLGKQIAEFYVNRTISDIKNITNTGINILPHFIKTTLEQGLSKGITEQIISIGKFHEQVKSTLGHADEIIQLLKKQKL